MAGKNGKVVKTGPRLQDIRDGMAKEYGLFIYRTHRPWIKARIVMWRETRAEHRLLIGDQTPPWRADIDAVNKDLMLYFDVIKEVLGIYGLIAMGINGRVRDYFDHGDYPRVETKRWIGKNENGKEDIRNVRTADWYPTLEPASGHPTMGMMIFTKSDMDHPYYLWVSGKQTVARNTGVENQTKKLERAFELGIISAETYRRLLGTSALVLEEVLAKMPPEPLMIGNDPIPMGPGGPP